LGKDKQILNKEDFEAFAREAAKGLKTDKDLNELSLGQIWCTPMKSSADLREPWQHSLNENTKCLCGQYFSKGTDLSRNLPDTY